MMDPDGLDPSGHRLGPGKTPPRLINDLLDYDPRYAAQKPRNLLADPAEQFRGRTIMRKGIHDCRHTLVRKDTQTTLQNDGSNPIHKYVVASYCTLCRYHFQITVDFSPQPGCTNPCNLADGTNPMHHLKITESIGLKAFREKYGEDKYRGSTELYNFACTGSHCPVLIEIRITSPRLGQQLLSGITDPVHMKVRSERIISAEPERLAGIPPATPFQVLGFLRSYLVDARSAGVTGEPRRIAKRNKKYLVGFANECDSLFSYLDFKTITEPTDDLEKEPDSFWQLPMVTDVNKDFVDDVILELQALISTRPPVEKPTGWYMVDIPKPALKDIEKSLGYFGYPTRSRTVDLSIEEHPHYASLGVVDNFTDDLLAWAYDRQCACDPANKPYYLDCLKDLADGRQSLDLQTKVVMATSAGEFGLKDIEEAYKFFALDPTATEGDDHIIGVYRSRVESAPRQKEEARQCLAIIAKARSSRKIEAVANDRTMSYIEALELLSVSDDTASEYIEAAAVAQSFDGDRARVATALQVIATKRNDLKLHRAAANMQTGDGEGQLPLSEAYTRLQITNDHIPDESVFAYYQSLSGNVAAGSKESYDQALRVIANDRGSAFLFKKLQDPNADIDMTRSTATEPVGLNNIGNTCYLNSLLQFYYTIRPVREVVTDIARYRMDLSDPDFEKQLNRKKVGGRTVDRQEIEKAQKFLAELHDLFAELRTAPTRSVEPSKKLAQLTLFGAQAEANLAEHRKKSISSPNRPADLINIIDSQLPIPDGPPPPPPVRPSPQPIEDDIEMVDRPRDLKMESDDTSSEATLVELEGLPSYEDAAVAKGPKKDSLVKVGQGPSDEEDMIMIDGKPERSETIDDKPAEAAVKFDSSAFEKPPPIPPRNKAGLSIQTGKNDTLDDDIWKFGTQQDVTEVIGNVVWRLQCAIKPSSFDEATGEQIDPIRDVFFGANAVYTQKLRTMERKVESWANLMVYPPPTGSRDIYEALDIVFDEQTVDVENLTTPQFASITKLPPVLQIQIQRTDYDKKTHQSSKNRNPVVFPETIYMDRYMDSQDPTVLARRRSAWQWKTQLRKLEARQFVLQNKEAEISVPEALVAAKQLVTDLQDMEIQGLDIDPSLLTDLDERGAQLAAELEQISSQIAALKQKLQELFTGMHEYEYKLQTVFIHRGEAGGGHYWIYIYDFKKDVWREYNDEDVSEVRDRKRIFEQQSAGGGTPYYLAYVRSKDTDELVDAVVRDVNDTTTDVEMGEGETWELPEGGLTQATSNTMEQNAAAAAAAMGNSQHLEHVKPRPILPKAAQWTGKFDDTQLAKYDAHGNEW